VSVGRESTDEDIHDSFLLTFFGTENKSDAHYSLLFFLVQTAL
jgi:hypothetical protein